MYKHYQAKSTVKTNQTLWYKECKTRETAGKAREKVRNMRTMLYRIEEAVSKVELKEIYLEFKATLLVGGDVTGEVWNKVWGADKVKRYDTRQMEMQKVETAGRNKALLKARDKALKDAIAERKKAKEKKAVSYIWQLHLTTTGVKAAGENKAAAKPDVVVNIEESDEEPDEEPDEEGQQKFDADENEERIKRLKLEIDLELKTQQSHCHDDHQSPVTAEHYSTSSPPHARAHALHTIRVSPHLGSRPPLTRTTRLTLSPISLHSPHSQSAHNPGLRRIHVQRPKSEAICCLLEGCALTVHRHTAAGCIRAAFKGGATVPPRTGHTQGTWPDSKLLCMCGLTLNFCTCVHGSRCVQAPVHGHRGTYTN